MTTSNLVWAFAYVAFYLIGIAAGVWITMCFYRAAQWQTDKTQRFSRDADTRTWPIDDDYVPLSDADEDVITDMILGGATVCETLDYWREARDRAEQPNLTLVEDDDS